jgi:hypothetical protein
MKGRLEEAIYRAIREFETGTGLTVNNVELIHLYSAGLAVPRTERVKVKCDIL